MSNEMNRPPGEHPSLRSLLEQVASGALTPEEGERALHGAEIREMGFASIDLQRQARRGRPEVIFCQGKTPEQIVAIAGAMIEAGQNVLATRIEPAAATAVKDAFPTVALIESAQARLLRLETTAPRRREGLVGVLAAGTTDIPVAEEAAQTAEFLGCEVERAYDVGVAGLHRLLRRADLLLRARVLVVVAGMEGALPSVVSGLVRAPVLAVPTTVGYGAHFQGLAPLLTMINSCSPGVAVLNIDNGFGAGYLADAILEAGAPHSR